MSSIKLPFTKKFNLKSKYNNENYNLFIRIPDEYDANQTKYPVLIVLDPNFLFSSLYGIKSIAQNYIICGIGHEKIDFDDSLSPKEKSYISEIVRSRDFLPFELDKNIFIKDAPQNLVKDILECTGRAEDFILFIQNDVMQFIKNNFRVLNENHTIFGHSFGAVFACFALLRHPEIFRNYIAISPILDSRYYVQKEMFGAHYKFSKEGKNNIYIAFGSLEDDDRTENYFEKLEKECRKITDHEKINGKFEFLEGEHHVSVALSGMFRGFNFIENILKN